MALSRAADLGEQTFVQDALGGGMLVVEHQAVRLREGQIEFLKLTEIAPNNEAIPNLRGEIDKIEKK